MARRQTDSGAPDGALILRTYAALKNYVGAFAQGHINLLILVGPPGLAKSRTVRAILRDDASWMEGNATAFGMYLQLYRNRDRFDLLGGKTDIEALGQEVLHDLEDVHFLQDEPTHPRPLRDNGLDLTPAFRGRHGLDLQDKPGEAGPDEHLGGRAFEEQGSRDGIGIGPHLAGEFGFVFGLRFG